VIVRTPLLFEVTEVWMEWYVRFPLHLPSMQLNSWAISKYAIAQGLWLYHREGMFLYEVLW
jgi:hypothetical protein